MNFVEKIREVYSYYKDVCKDLKLPELTNQIVEKLNSKLKNYIEDSKSDPREIYNSLSIFYDDIFEWETIDKISGTGFGEDLLNVIADNMSVTEVNYFRLLNIISEIPILDIYYLLFTKYMHFMDIETKEKLIKEAKTTFIEEVLVFLPDEQKNI